MTRRSIHAFALLLSLSLLRAVSSPDASGAQAPPPTQSVGSAYHHPAALPAYATRIGEPGRSREDAIFEYYVDRVLSEHFQYNPEAATNAGIHDFDTLLTQTSAEGIEARAAFARNFAAHLQLISEGELTPARRIDHQLIATRLAAWNFENQHERPFARDPNHYIGIVSNGVQSLLHRSFAPLEDRVRSLNARLAQVPRVFQDARQHLEAPPRVHTELAVEQARGLATYLEGAVVEQVRGLSDPALRQEFERRHAAALEAARGFADWLATELLPRSTGEFALGETRYRQKLLHEEMVDTDLDELLRRARASSQETRSRIEEAARQLDPGISVEEVLRRMDADVPDEAKLLDETRKQLAAIRSFLAKNPVMTLPAEENLIVAETPPFRRGTSFASMSSPGVLERSADEAYYYVTPPGRHWPPERKAEFLTFFNPYSLRNVSVHEAYPGHYYQFLTLRRCSSTARALLGSRSNSEGWAHYCEEMMIEEGLGKEDLRYRIAQLRGASVRLCRLIAGISLHARGMSLEEAQRLFEEEGYLTPVNAGREARRGAVDPTYGVYTLGKWQILDLREEFRVRMGAEYRLRDFHDRLLAQGRAPLPLARQALLVSLPAPGLRRSP